MRCRIHTYLMDMLCCTAPSQSPNESTKEKIFENIVNVNPTQEVRNNLARCFLLLFDNDSIYDTNYKSLVNFWNSNDNRIQKKLDDKTPESYFK